MSAGVGSCVVGLGEVVHGCCSVVVLADVVGVGLSVRYVGVCSINEGWVLVGVVEGVRA